MEKGSLELELEVGMDEYAGAALTEIDHSSDLHEITNIDEIGVFVGRH